MLGPATGYLLMTATLMTVATYAYRLFFRRGRSTPGRDASGRGRPEKAMSVVLGEFDALFSPGSIHWQQEKQRIAMMRENQESGDPPFGPIDLISGKVVIRRPAEEEPTQEPVTGPD